MANDFSGDANCKAVWNFESDALTTDSKGTNTLTDVNTVGENTTDYKQGSCSADIEFADNEEFSIANADMDAGFPLKEGDSIKKISVCFWFRFETLPTTTGQNCRIYSMSQTGKYSIVVYVATTDVIRISIGYNEGASVEYLSLFGTAFAANIWYHVAFTFQDSDGAYRIRIWDDNAGALLDADTTGNAAENINVEDSNLRIGRTHDGELDEMVVFDDILSPAEIDEIRAGTYGAVGGVTVTPEVISLGAIQPDETLKVGSTLTPAVISFAAVQPEKTLKMGASVAPEVISLTSSQPDDTLKMGAKVSPETQDLVSSQPDDTLSIGSTLSPEVQPLISSQPEAVFKTGCTIAVEVQTLVSEIQAEAVKCGTTQTPEVQSLLATIQDEIVKAGVTILPIAMTLSAVPQDETVILPGSITITPDVVIITSQTGLPVVLTGKEARILKGILSNILFKVLECRN